MTKQLQSDAVIADRYRIVNRVGVGAMSDVYAAVDERLQRRVAVKLFRAGADDQPRFERESKTLVGVQHPNIVGVLDAGEHEGLPFVVLDLYDHDLSQLIADGPMPPEDVAVIGSAVANGLAAAHAAGVVHRDVKPSNILLSDGERVVLADFGVARLTDQTRLTATAATIGTPAYLAPEQAAGEPVGPPADVYSLGLVLIEALSGARPFAGSYQESLAARLLREPELPASASLEWRELLGAMTRRDPDERPTAAEVADSLANFGGDDATALVAPVAVDESATMAMPRAATTTMRTTSTRMATPPVVDRRGGSWVPAAAAILIAALMLGAIALALANRDADPNPAPEAPTTTVATTPVTRAPAVAPTAPATTEAPAEEDNAALCDSYDQQLEAIEASKQQSDEQFADDPETREQMAAQFDSQEQAIEQQKQEAGC